MEESIYYANLYDIYGELLTDKQKSYFKDYYFDNLTMDEIAYNDKVSKNAVSKQLKDVREKLLFYEEKLKIYQKKMNIEREFKNEEDILNRIEKYDNI